MLRNLKRIVYVVYRLIMSYHCRTGYTHPDPEFTRRPRAAAHSPAAARPRHRLTAASLRVRLGLRPALARRRLGPPALRGDGDGAAGDCHAVERAARVHDGGELVPVAHRGPRADRRGRVRRAFVGSARQGRVAATDAAGLLCCVACLVCRTRHRQSIFR